MPTTTKTSFFKKYMPSVREWVFIITTVVSIIGWVYSVGAKKSKLEATVENLATEVKDNTKQLEKLNDIMLEQQELNGKIILYMQMKQ